MKQVTDTKKYVIRDREAGNFITDWQTMEEAKMIVESYYAQDIVNDCFTPDFYEIVEMNNPQTTDTGNTEFGEDFYNLMQLYRTAKTTDQGYVTECYNNVQNWITEQVKELTAENQILKNDILNGLRIEKVQYDENTSLKETIAALEERNGKLVEALETLLEGNEQDPDNPLRWWQRITPQSEALNKAKEALSNNSK